MVTPLLLSTILALSSLQCILPSGCVCLLHFRITALPNGSPLSFFLAYPSLIGLIGILILIFHKDSQVRVCLKSERRLWI